MTRLLPSAFFVEENVLSEAIFGELEEKGRVRLPSRARERLQGLANLYLEHRTAELKSVSPGKVRSFLDEVAQASRNLASLLEQNKGDERHAAYREILMASRNLPHRFERLALRDRLLDLARASELAGAGLPEDTGRPPDSHLGNFLLALQVEFRAAGGAGIFTDPAIDFLWTICKAVGSDILSKTALKKRLQTARRENPELAGATFVQ